MKIYVSGPISGLKREEVEQRFAEVVRQLEDIGLEVVSPLDNGLPPETEWIKHMCRDIGMLHACEAIYLMSGWQESVGACVEHDFALRTGKTILFEASTDIYPTSQEVTIETREAQEIDQWL